MDCKNIRELLYPYLDGECSAEQAKIIEAHLQECPLCALESQQEKNFNKIVKDHITKESAPFELREQILDSIENKNKFALFLNDFFRSSMARISFVSVFMLFLTIGVIVNTVRPFPMFSESVESHLTYLKGGYPLEIKTSDINEVKEWFKGKVNFAIHLPSILKNRIQLQGARLCHLKDQKVAYLMLERDGQNISLFVMDTEGLRIPRAKKVVKGDHVFYVKSHNGYQSILCLNKRRGSAGCLFVTTLPEEEIMKLMV